MVYKIGNVADLDMIPLIDDTALELLLHYARVLTIEYGENRNIDEDDGGFLIYAPSGTPTEEIKACFKASYKPAITLCPPGAWPPDNITPTFLIPLEAVSEDVSKVTVGFP